MNKADLLLIFGILLIFTGCATKTHDSISGTWQPPSGKGDLLELIEDGTLISHMEFKPDLSKFEIPTDKAIIEYQDLEISGTWKFINNSDIVLTLEFSNETITVTNSIVQITDEMMVMNINGTNSIYTRVQ